MNKRFADILKVLKEVVSDWIIWVFIIFDIIGILFYFFSGIEINKNCFVIFLASGMFFSFVKITINKNKEIERLKKGDGDHDVVLFKKITEEILPTKETIDFLRNHCFGSRFAYEKMLRLYRFNDLCEGRGDFIFINKQLEKNKLSLYTSIKDFFVIAQYNIDVIDIEGIQYAHVPKDFNPDDPEKCYRIINQLDYQSRYIAYTYNQFLRLGTKELSLPFKE